MGRASISIAITSNFNSSGIDAAIRKAEQLAVAYTHSRGQFGKAAVDMGASMGQASARLVEMGRSMAKVGDTLTTHVTVPMGLAATAAVMSAAKIDTAWYNVRKTVDMTEEGYERLKRGAMELSEVQPVSAETILNIEAMGGQLGIANGNLEDFAKTVSGLDIATNMNAEAAASALAQFRNITQMSEDDLDNFASALVDLGNNTATTENDMMQLALKFASAGHVAGMSNQDILGLSAALAGLGMKADAGGSALSQVINKIGVDVAKGGADVEKWANLVGEAPEKFAEAWRRAPTEQFVKVLQAIGRDGADANEILNELGITQIRQSDAMRRLASSGDLVTESIERANRAWSENTALQREVDNRNESLQARWDTLVNRFTNDLARIGQPIAEIGLDVAEGLEPVIQGVGDLAQAFADADPAVQRFAFNLGAIAMAAGPVLSVAGRLVQAVGNVGQWVGRQTQQWGVYREALQTTDIAMARNMAQNDSLAARMGIARNEMVRSAGGVQAWRNQVEAATTVVGENAGAVVRNGQAVTAYAEALGVGDRQANRFSGGVRSSADAVKFATGVNQRYREAVANGAGSMTEAAQIALQYRDNTAASAVEANRAANEALGYSGALESQAKSGTEAARAALRATESRRAQRDQTRAASDAVQHMSKVEMDAALATERGREELDRLNASADRASVGFGKFGDALKGALIGFGVSAAIGLAVAGITWLVSSMQEAAEHADLMDRATNGLRGSLHGVGEAAQGAGDAQRNLVGSIAQTHQTVQNAIEQQAELADKFLEVDKQASVQIGTLDKSAEIIEKYANKGGIGVAQLNLLKSAIDDVNQACGTQYQVLEDGAVVYETEAGAIQANTDEILKNIDARKRQIQMEATESKYQSAYQNLIDQTYARAEAQTKLNKARERYNELREKDGPLTAAEWDEYNALGVEINRLEQEVSDLDETWRAAADTERYWASLLESQGGALEGLTQGMQDLLGPTSMLTVYFAAAEKDVIAFAAACEEAGINWQFLNSLTESEIQQLAADFDGSTTSIVASLERIGKTEALDNLASNWREKVGDATYALAEGIASAHDVSVARIAAMAHDLGIEGEQAMQTFLNGIELGLSRGLNVEQAGELGRRITEEFKEGLNPDEAERLMTEYMNNLARGMGSKAALEAAIQSLKESLSQVNFTFEGQQAAQTWLAGFNLGGGGGDGTGLQPFANGLYGELDTIHNTVNEKGQITGQDVPLKIAEGIDASAGAVGGSADTMVQDLVNRLLGGVAGASDAGTQTGEGYGNSVSGQGSVAEQAAMQTLGRLLEIWLLGIASAQQAGARTGEAYGQGVSASATLGVAVAQQAVATIVNVLNSGVGPALAAGSNTGRNYGYELGQGLLDAATFADEAVRTIVSSLESGAEPAASAGREVGQGFAQGMKDEGGKAPGIARGISESTGYAFGSGAGAASASGASLGSAFASAVWSSGGRAIAYARSIRDSVKDIFSSIPTANIRVNVTRTVSTVQAARAAAYALPSPTPVAPVPAARAVETARRAVERISTPRASAGSGPSSAVPVLAAVRSQAAPIDYDAMERVVRAGVMGAIRDSGGLAPTIELDGRVVSRQLASRMDYELGRLDRMRG